MPAACAGQNVPSSIGLRRRRVCGLFTAAAGETRRSRAVRRLRRSVQALAGTIRLASAAARNGVSADCVAALKDQLRDARGRAARLLRP
jgi:hypothetical protein